MAKTCNKCEHQAVDTVMKSLAGGLVDLEASFCLYWTPPDVPREVAYGHFPPRPAWCPLPDADEREEPDDG